MKIKIYEKESILYSDIMNHIISVIRELPSCNLGLATGSTPEKLYKEMINAYLDNKYDPKLITTFNLDEYVGLDTNHPLSYHKYMEEKLFKYVPFKKTYIPNGIGDLDENVEKYNKLLLENPIDIQILGIGTNGHIAFNEPNTKFDSLTHIVSLTEKTRIDNSRFFNSLKEVPKKAITMGIKNIMAAKEIILIATGKHKKDAIYQMIKEDITPIIPASILRKHPKITVYLDEKSASRIKGENKHE